MDIPIPGRGLEGLRSEAADAARWHTAELQADQLQDDASIVILEWRTGTERQLQL